jgi:hypothetical protein
MWNIRVRSQYMAQGMTRADAYAAASAGDRQRRPQLAREPGRQVVGILGGDPR